MSGKWIRFASSILILLIAFQSAAFADAIQGRVAHADSQALDVTVYDQQGRPYPNVLHLDVDDRTQVNGVSSIMNLRPNDAISAEVSQEESRSWHADRITLFQEINARPATQNPSSSPRDVLGNPVVRGALLGAATGAIASSASGGKVGKGALVGAGVGAAAGILGGLFSKKSDQSSDSN